MLVSVPVHGQARRTEADLLIFELRLGKVVLSDGFPGFKAGPGYRLPLGELCRELDLAIQVDPARGLAEGFLIQESRRFSLDARAGTLTVDGVTSALDRSLLEADEADIYLDPMLLARCLPVDVAVAGRTMVVTLTPREVLPLQERWQREAAAGRLQRDAGPLAFGPADDPYRFLEIPALDAALGVAGSQSSPGRFPAQASLLAAGDLLWTSGSVFAMAQNPGGLTEFRMTLGRRDPRGELLGPLRATAFAMGEVLSPGLNLMASPTAGTGFLVTNRPLQSGNAFDRHSFQGDLPPGWQVELYRNSGLMAFQASRPDGRYQFLDVPLTFGPNEFRLVFYGPQGQRREEAARFDVGENQVPRGELHYLAAATRRRDAAGARSGLQLDFGLTERVTAHFGASRVTLDGVDHDYAQAGLQGFWRFLSGNLTAGRDSRGGTIGELALRTRLGPFSLAGKETFLRDGFRSEVFQAQGGQIRRRTTLEGTAVLPGPARPWFSLDFGAHRDALATGGSTDTWNLQLATTFEGLFLSGQVSRSTSRGLQSPVPATSTGAFLASRVFPSFSLRGQASFTLGGVRKLDALALTADLTRFEPWTLQAGLARSIGSRETSGTLGLNRTQGAFSLGVGLAYATSSRFSANISLRMGIAREPRRHGLFTKAQGVTSCGAVSAQAFLDANGNGARDTGEKPVPNVGFLVNGAAHPHTTDPGGVAFLDGLPQDVEANIAVAPGTLEDPLMRPLRPGARVTPRGGHVVRLEIPVAIHSEITGTTYRRQDGRRRELPGLRLELRDASGKVVRSLRSAFDGFFTLGDLPPGTYTLEVPAAAARALGAAPPGPRTVKLAPEGSVLDGVDLVLDLPGTTE